jgi:1-acyl-sn-glycerol-3-phosphate acyltransferase
MDCMAVARERLRTNEHDGLPSAGPEDSESLEEPTEREPDDIDHWGRSERFRALVRTAFEPFYRYWFRVEWEGLEHVPLTGGALLVANHAGALPPDAPVIMHGIEKELGRPVYGLADYWFRTVPFLSIFWNRAGGVTAHPENGYRLLREENQLVLVFPEGTKGTGKLFKDRYRLQRFGRGGFVELAMRAGVPIVPIAVVGAEEAMPILFKVPALASVLKMPYFPITLNQLVFSPVLGPVLGSLMYLPAKFYVRVLPPVTFSVPPEQERYNKALVMEEAEQIRVRIQDALTDMLSKRKKVWF